MPHILCISLLLILFLLPAPTEAQENEETSPSELRDRSSRIMPMVAYEVGTPGSIRRAPGVVNRERFQADGNGRSVDYTAIFGLSLLFPRIVDDAFGLSVEFSLAQSDGWFESDPFLDSIGTVNRVTRERVTSSNLFRVDTDESQGRLALLGTWDTRSFRVAAGPWAGYRSSSRLTQIERIDQPANAVFVGTNDTARVVGAGSDITATRWRFGGTARIERDIYLSRTFALVPQITGRFDGASLFTEGLGLRAFSIGFGLGFSVAWRPDPIARLEELLAESQAIPPPTLTIESRGYRNQPLESTGDTIIIREERVRETDLVAIPERWPVSDRSLLLESDAYRVTSAEQLARLPLDELLLRIPGVLLQRMREDTLASLRLTPEGATGAARSIARGGAERLLAEMIAGGISSERIAIDSARQVSDVTPSIHLKASTPQLLDPLLLQRNVVTLLAPDLAIRREGRIDTGSGWSMVLRQDGELIGAGGLDMEGAFSIERSSLREGGGMVTVGAIREEDGEIIDGSSDTLFYRLAQSAGDQTYRWILPGSGAADRDGTVYRAFVQLAASVMRSEPKAEVVVMVSRVGTIGREEVIADLLRGAGPEFRGSLTAKVLPPDHPLNLSPWSRGIIIRILPGPRSG